MHICLIKKSLYPFILKAYSEFQTWWAGMDSNHRRCNRRIYSPLHLAALQPTHKILAPRRMLLELVKGIEPSTC